MLTQLFQRLNKFLNHPVDHHQSLSFEASRELEVEQPLPQLTNADLEVLFNELLTGVQQGRGQQWAIEYLQRMEDRISVDRWIDWLLIFGEKLLLSPSPNHQLAQKMMQLGELGIGTVGELSYDIGIRLVTGKLGVPYQEESTKSEIVNDPLDSPGQELVTDVGEWLGNEPPAPEVDPVAEHPPEVIWEYAVSPTATTAPLVVTPVEKPVAEVEKNQIIPSTAITSSPGNWYQSLVNLQPNVAETLDELLVRLDQSTSLVQQLAANLSPTTVNHQDAGEDWFYHGLQLAKTGDLQGAIAAYNQAIEINPDVAEYWFNRGLTLFHLQDFTGAIAAYDQAITLKPHHYKAWCHRGRIYGELGEFTDAIACFDQAIAIKPQHPEGLSSKALALLKLGQIPEAIANYDQALHLEPENADNWYYRGIALAVVEQFTDAIASYDQAIEIQPDFHEVWIDRGVVLFTLGHWSDAIASWDQALAQQPDLYLAWYNRGIALENLGEREQAIASYQKAIEIKPDFHLAWYNQALALSYLDRFDQAILAYDNALEIKPDYWEAWMGRGTAIGHLPTPNSNSALQQTCYTGQLATYAEALKHLYPDTHPEGWGRLHIATGNTHYEQGKKSPQTRYYWHQAIAEYQQALSTLTIEDFSELHLEVLQSLTKTYLGLGDTAQAQQLQQQAADLLAQLLTQSPRTDTNKKQLALKFAGIGQLEVDLAVESGDLVEAWEMAEQGKNSCITWLLSDWQEQIYSHYYSSVQKLLNPHTAIIYWHISPVSLHTFIIKDQAPSPILLFTPIQDIGIIDSEELPLPEGVRRLIEFENWLEDWHQKYQTYLHQNPDKHSKTQHIWRVQMAEKLLQLQEILQISTITQELEDISQLILIPHRDLHQLPLHSLFSLNAPSHHLSISYLPSVQKGLSLAPQTISPLNQQNFLSIENNSSITLAKFASKIINKMFNNSLTIPGDHATKNQVLNALPDHHILNFIGTVHHNLSDPKKSALLLLNQEKLILEEIYLTNLNNYKLVNLSAHQTNNNKKYPITSEYIDLANSFVSQGVPHVLTTLWEVESPANTLVMMEFYRRLQLNKSPVIALAEATSWLQELTAFELTKWYEDLLNNLDVEDLTLKAYLATYLYRTSKMPPDTKVYSHPYYWAAYTIKGIV